MMRPHKIIDVISI